MADIIPSNQATRFEVSVPTAPREPVPPGQVSANSLWRAFRARWGWAVLAGVVLGGTAAGVALLLNPSRFHAAALIRVLSTKAGVFDHGNVQETDKSPFQRAQPSILTSRAVLRSAATSERGRAIGGSGKYGELTGWLERNVKVSYLEDTDVMQISLAGPDSRETADLLNLVVTAYMEEAIKAEKNQLAEQIEILSSAAIGLQENLRREKDNLAALAKTLKTVDPKALSVLQTMHVEDLARARGEVAAIQAQIRELEVKSGTLKAYVASPPGEQISMLVEQHVEADPLVVKQYAIVRDKEEILLRAKNSSLPGSPALARYDDAVKNAKIQLEGVRAYALAESKRVDEEMRVRKSHLQIAMENQDRMRKELDRLGTTSFELETKRADIDQEAATLKKVRDQKEQLQVESQSNRARIQLLQRAEAPESKNTRSRDTVATLAGIGGLFFGLVGTSMLELHARRIQSAEEVSHDLGMNVVGTLPVLPNRWSSGNGVGDGYWGHLVTESVAYIRTVVLCDRGPSPTRVLMITSAQSQEGKTMLASNLALSIARTGRRTLLVDGDLRRPSVASLFGVPDGPGISEILRGEAGIAECIHPSRMPGLSLLPAGKSCRQVIQELARDGVHNLFQQLRQDYDFVVVDSCPLLPVSDSLLLGRLVDAVVLCVRPKVSRAPSVCAAREMLDRLNIPVLGTVINGARRHSAGGSDYLYLLGETNGTVTPAAGAANP